MKRISSLLLLIAAPLISQAQADECTIGVAAGKATADGRPMVWKTRDFLDEPDNEVRLNTSYTYTFVAVVNAGSTISSWMGVNEHGFAMVNSNSTDLPDGSSTGPSNGTFISMALGSCKTVDEFQALLDQTNITGRTTNANYGVIDSTGAAAIFETGNTVYWKFDAADDPKGYVLRTNFAINGGGSSGTARLIRTVKLIGDFYNGDSLSHKSILRHQMRDFSNASSQPIPIPFDGNWGVGPHGYIDTDVSICRYTSVSAAVIHGTLPTEPAACATMWTILGQPATSVALPYWPKVYPPGEADGLFTAPLHDAANQIKNYLFDLTNPEDYLDTYKLLDGQGNGLFTRTFPFEDQVLDGTASLMQAWRSQGMPPLQDMKNTEDSLAYKTHQFLLSCQSYLASAPGEFSGLSGSVNIFPNPFHESARLAFETGIPADVEIEIYSLAGIKLEHQILPGMAPGTHEISVGSGLRDSGPGMYILRLSINGYSRHFKIIRK